MRSRDSLDARIIANILVLGGVSSIVFGIVIYAMSELVEVTLLDFLETLAVQQASGTDGEAVFDIGRKIDGQDDLLLYHHRSYPCRLWRDYTQWRKCHRFAYVSQGAAWHWLFAARGFYFSGADG